MLKVEKRPRDIWYVYILLCKDKTFYTGITKDLDRRVNMHNTGKASRYTRTRGPVKIIYQEKLKGRAKALTRECKIKSLSRKAKERLVEEGG